MHVAQRPGRDLRSPADQRDRGQRCGVRGERAAVHARQEPRHRRQPRWTRGPDDRKHLGPCEACRGVDTEGAFQMPQVHKTHRKTYCVSYCIRMRVLWYSNDFNFNKLRPWRAKTCRSKPRLFLRSRVPGSAGTELGGHPAYWCVFTVIHGRTSCRRPACGGAFETPRGRRCSAWRTWSTSGCAWTGW